MLDKAAMKKDNITNQDLAHGLKKIKDKANIKGNVSQMKKDQMLKMYDSIGYEYVNNKRKMRINPIPIPINKMKYPLVVDFPKTSKPKPNIVILKAQKVKKK